MVFLLKWVRHKNLENESESVQIGRHPVPVCRSSTTQNISLSILQHRQVWYAHFLNAKRSDSHEMLIFWLPNSTVLSRTHVLLDLWICTRFKTSFWPAQIYRIVQTSQILLNLFSKKYHRDELTVYTDPSPQDLDYKTRSHPHSTLPAEYVPPGQVPRKFPGLLCAACANH